MAETAVSLALSKLYEGMSFQSNRSLKKEFEELAIELEWLKCFLIHFEKTAQGRSMIDVFSKTIDRFSVRVREMFGDDDNNGRIIVTAQVSDLIDSFARLREKLQPFLTCNVQSSASSNIPVYSALVPSIQVPKEIIQLEAFGNRNGSQWDFLPRGTIKKIYIAYDDKVVHSIDFTFLSADGVPRYPFKFGGNGGIHTREVFLNGPSEYLTGISGVYVDYNGLKIIKGLRFKTNFSTGIEFGSFEKGDCFSFGVEDGKIVGFHGLAVDYINAIGIYAAPTNNLCSYVVQGVSSIPGSC